ncbi:hypothetical protein [Phaffia rhodozyma]|uniref:Uncharacterized protein n=1 Tax=Phaffia rhodozyma TaxID=264483 RepID=A0A0F7SJA9_PHARH|nr:hypothetical protein [Phaffia rhodozyma]
MHANLSVSSSDTHANTQLNTTYVFSSPSTYDFFFSFAITTPIFFAPYIMISFLSPYSSWFLIREKKKLLPELRPSGTENERKEISEE